MSEAGRFNFDPASHPRARDTLLLRVGSAAVLAPAALLTSFAGGRIFAGLVAFLCVLMAFEWARMVERAETSKVLWALGVAAAGAIALAAAGRYPLAFAVCLVGALAAAIGSKKSPLWAASGAYYFLAPAVALVWLRNDVPHGRELTLLLFAIVWSADTGGYTGGRLFGGPKLAPALSPAKTWAGLAGGVLFGAIAAWFAAPYVFPDLGPARVLAIGAGLGGASILGDIVESGFKRRHGIKDMSGFIPGHGGVLDRLDGMIFATTATAIFLYGRILAAHVSVAGALG